MCALGAGLIVSGMAHLCALSGSPQHAIASYCLPVTALFVINPTLDVIRFGKRAAALACTPKCPGSDRSF